MQFLAAWWRFLLITVALVPALALDLPPLVPAVHRYDAQGGPAFHLPKLLHVVVDEHDAHLTKDDGLTLIPPTLLDFAQIFKADLEALFPHTVISLATGDVQKSSDDTAKITFSLSDNLTTTLADGSPTTEGYQLDVSPTRIQITGAGSKGAFWATRTLLQGLVLSGGQFPSGKVADQPDWRTRGFMLGSQSIAFFEFRLSRSLLLCYADVGRQWYPISFLQELCTYASWFKLSEFVSS